MSGWWLDEQEVVAGWAGWWVTGGPLGIPS